MSVERFQCSSASRKFLNGISREKLVFEVKFQCSSASRKFLNRVDRAGSRAAGCFSALQRAENSSMARGRCPQTSSTTRFSALQRAENSSIVAPLQATHRAANVSVLFSEPKIPQLVWLPFAPSWRTRFSALQRAENSSTASAAALRAVVRVSVLFSEPKIPQIVPQHCAWLCGRVSVLFSEPKIPQFSFSR